MLELLAIVLSIVIVNSTTEWNSLLCPKGWTISNGFCWKWEQEPVTWAEARASCMSIKADLASIHSESQNRLMMTLIDMERRSQVVKREANKSPNKDQSLNNNQTCFERHTNSILVGFAEAVISAANVDECQSECLVASVKYNVHCRSLMYYSESRDCILNAQTRFTRPDLFTTDSNGSAVDYYDNTCYGDQARRMPTGNNCFQLYQHMALYGFAEQVFVGISVQQCQDECVQAKATYNFDCLSTTFYPTEQTCILTRESKLTKPNLFGPEAMADYYERSPTCNVNPQPGCSKNAMDLFFIVDSSNSIGAESFENVRHFLKTLVGSFNVGPRGVMVGLAQFNEDPKTEFHLKSYQTTPEVLAAIDAMKWMGGRTLIGKALRFALDYEFVVSEGNRVPDVPDVIVLLTDGLSQDNPLLAAQLIRSSGITVYAVGVTEAVQDQQLINIAGNPNRVYKILDFAQLDSRLRDQIVQDICRPVMKKPEPEKVNACSPSPYYSCPPDTTVVAGYQNSAIRGFEEQNFYKNGEYNAFTGKYDVVTLSASSTPYYGNYENPLTSSSTVQQQSFPSPPPFAVSGQPNKFAANKSSHNFKTGTTKSGWKTKTTNYDRLGVWLGLSDQFDEDNFVWVDKTPLNYTKWKFGQPDGNKSENCVLSLNEPLQRWIDASCSAKNSYVCKKKPNLIQI